MEESYVAEEGAVESSVLLFEQFAKILEGEDIGVVERELECFIAGCKEKGVEVARYIAKTDGMEGMLLTSNYERYLDLLILKGNRIITEFAIDILRYGEGYTNVVRVFVIDVLTKNKVERAKELLLRCVINPSEAPMVRASSIKLLGVYGYTEAIPFIRHIYEGEMTYYDVGKSCQLFMILTKQKESPNREVGQFSEEEEEIILSSSLMLYEDLMKQSAIALARLQGVDCLDVFFKMWPKINQFSEAVMGMVDGIEIIGDPAIDFLCKGINEENYPLVIQGLTVIGSSALPALRRLEDEYTQGGMNKMIKNARLVVATEKDEDLRKGMVREGDTVGAVAVQRKSGRDIGLSKRERDGVRKKMREAVRQNSLMANMIANQLKKIENPFCWVTSAEKERKLRWHIAIDVDQDRRVVQISSDYIGIVNQKGMIERCFAAHIQEEEPTIPIFEGRQVLALLESGIKALSDLFEARLEGGEKLKRCWEKFCEVAAQFGDEYQRETQEFLVELKEIDILTISSNEWMALEFEMASFVEEVDLLKKLLFYNEYRDKVCRDEEYTPDNQKVFFESLQRFWQIRKVESACEALQFNISVLPIFIQSTIMKLFEGDNKAEDLIQGVRGQEDQSKKANILLAIGAFKSVSPRVLTVFERLLRVSYSEEVFRVHAEIVLLGQVVSETVGKAFENKIGQGELIDNVLRRANMIILVAFDFLNRQESPEEVEDFIHQIREYERFVKKEYNYVLELKARIDEIGGDLPSVQGEVDKLIELTCSILKGEAKELPEDSLRGLLSAYDEFASPAESVEVLERKLEELHEEQREAFRSLKKGKGYRERRRKLKDYYYNKRESLGYQLHRQKNPTPVQIPIGIGHDPRKERQVQRKSIGLLRVLFDSERSAEKDGVPRRIVVYDTPQVTNYLHFISSASGEGTPREYIEHLAQERGGTVEAVSYAVARAIGEQEKVYFDRLIQSYGLKNIEVISFGEIEQDPVFQELVGGVRQMIKKEEGLQRALLNTVDPRFLMKSGFDIKGKKHPGNKEEVRTNLAEYAVKVIALHIWNRGDTVVHKAEKKNYQITLGILGMSRSWRKSDENLKLLVEILKKRFPEVTEKDLKQIRFPNLKSFQGVSLDDNEAPEEYKAHGAGEEVFLRANQVLLSGDKLSWLKFITDEHGKREEFVQEVVVPLLVGHYYFSHGPEGGREQLRKALGKVVGWSDVCDLVSGTIGEKLATKTNTAKDEHNPQPIPEGERFSES